MAEGLVEPEGGVGDQVDRDQRRRQIDVEAEVHGDLAVGQEVEADPEGQRQGQQDHQRVRYDIEAV